MKVNGRRPRDKHRRAILEKLPLGRASSRTELARETGLSPATVSRIAHDLVRRKVLREVARSAPAKAPGPRRRVGRPLAGLEINGSYGTVVGVSLLYPKARALVLSLRGEVIKEAAQPIEWHRGAASILERLKGLVRGVCRDRSRVSAIGLALPGQWDRERGVSLMYPRVADWKDVPIRKLVEEWTRAPAFLMGYAPALALAEHVRGSGAEPQGLLALEVADNIAMGVVANGKLLEGAAGNAGELGHITLDPQGPVCYCGNTGCLETLASCRAVEEQARQMDAGRTRFGKAPATYEQVAALAKEGDPFAARLLGRTATTLGIGLASAVNLFNPERVVLNGRFFDAGDLVLGPLQASLVNRALANSTKKMSIERSRLGPTAPALGAGLLAIREVLQRL